MKIKRGYKISSIIPVASMSDIAFLLLVFMLLSSILTPQPPIKLEVPKITKTAELKEEEGLRIYLASNQLASINQQIIPLANIEAFIPAAIDEEQKVYLYADANCAFEQINKILTLLKKNDYRQLTFICQENKQLGF